MGFQKIGIFKPENDLNHQAQMYHSFFSKPEYYTAFRIAGESD
jgi:hypothetical protein